MCLHFKHHLRQRRLSEPSVKEAENTLGVKANKKMVQQHFVKKSRKVIIDKKNEVPKMTMILCIFELRNGRTNMHGILIIDATYRLNNLCMPLYVMMIMDGNGDSSMANRL